MASRGRGTCRSTDVEHSPGQGQLADFVCSHQRVPIHRHAISRPPPILFFMPAGNEDNQSLHTPDWGHDSAAAREPPAAGDALAAEPATLTDPVTVAERISAVDVLRGVALLGILLINITSFGLPYDGQRDLLLDSSHDTDTLVWFVMTVLFEGKMRALFSIVFGAGVILLTERFERRGDVSRVADIYYRRTLWLLAFGLVHSYFFWDGDILTRYGILGLFLYPFRKLRGPTLVALGVLVLALTVPLAAITVRQLERRHAAAVEAQSQEAAGQPLTRSERDELTEWQDAARPRPS